MLNALLSQSNSDSLSPQEKEAHGNLISSLVGAIGLGLGTDAVTAVVSARTETENNYLNAGEVRRMMEDLQGCRSAGDGDACRDEVKERYLALSKANGGSGLYGCKAEGESACNAQYSEVQEGNQLLEALERLGWSGAEYAVLDDLLELNWNDERIADGAWLQSWYQDAGVPVSVGIGVVAGAGIRAEAAAARTAVLRGTSQGTANSATASRLADDLASKMSKPAVADPSLSKMMDEIYRPGAKIGSGSTADAVRLESVTGQQVGGVWHKEKAQNYSVGLRRWLNSNPNASFSDRSAASNVLRDLQNALNGK